MKVTRFGACAAVAAVVVLRAAGGISDSGAGPSRAGNGIDSPHGLAVAPNGTKVFITGDSDGGMKTNYDFATIAYDAKNGKRIWVARYGAPAGRAEGGEAIGVSGDGKRVYVAGATASKKSWDYGTLAYDAATGKRLWVARYDGPAGRADGAEDLALSADGTKVFVTGTSDGGKVTNDDFATVAFEARTGRAVGGAL